ncbi:MAG TPA: ABC transporter substrate-binding protein [Dehalococcoidia bacterium]|nr:ABC transporter substrate-binding protein [Dehalococcoidia bacterium]
MPKGNSRWFMLVAVTIALAVAVMACGPAATPTPTPTKAPAATPTKAAEPAKPAATATTAPAKALEPVTLGFVNSFSGFMAPMGQPERDLVLMMEEKINKEGGINGRPLKVIAYDDESDETKGVLAMKKLIESDKVLAIIGTAASGIGMAQAPVVEEAKVPWMTLQSARSTILPDRKWIFKTPVSERTFVAAIYRFMKARGFNKFALLNQGAGFGREARKYMEETAQKEGFTIVAKEEYGPNDTDMKPQLTKVKATDAQFLIVYGAEAAGAIAVRQAKEVGLNMPLIGPPSLALPAIMANKELRDGLEGFYMAGFKSSVWEQLSDTDPMKKVNADLAKLLKDKYNRPTSDITWEAQAYDPFTVLTNAIKTANPDPTKLEEARSKIRDALENNTKNFVGAISLMTFTPTEHEGWTQAGALEMVVQVQIKEGKFTVVK